MNVRFQPGEVWLDTEGRPIQAHGGGVLRVGATFYWYGENKDAPTRAERIDVVGISCYSSTDLMNWRNEGVVLPAVDRPGHDLHPSRVLERPKVVFDPGAGRYVLWAHVDSADYRAATVGVATSPSPTGPFEYRGAFRPDGAESRDLTLFRDDDGSAYLVTGHGYHEGLHLARLADDLLGTSGAFVRAFARPGPPLGREAPCLFRHAGRLYLVTSGTTGWRPNPAEAAVADGPFGPWTELGDPCDGTPEQRATTFDAQGTFVLPVPGRENAFVFMADRWNPADLRDSRYVWLPMRVEEGRPRIVWRDAWDLSVFDEPWPSTPR